MGTKIQLSSIRLNNRAIELGEKSASTITIDPLFIFLVSSISTQYFFFLSSQPYE